jgi:DNA-binding transcriptional ArsR family regulator
MTGDVDLAAVGELLADRSRCRILTALDDGRALPASVLAGEAGVATSTASAHLSRLVDAGMLAMEAHGRHRYYRLAGPQVGELIEAVAKVAPAQPVRSLREGTRAEALRRGRTCYDHLAGRLGVGIMAALLRQEWLAGGDGCFHSRTAGRDRLSAPGWDVSYTITDRGAAQLAALGVDCSDAGRRPLVRYCVDWSEQRHHLAGALGARLAVRLQDMGWTERSPNNRAVRITEAGGRGLGDDLGVDVGAVLAPTGA